MNASILHTPPTPSRPSFTGLPLPKRGVAVLYLLVLLATLGFSISHGTATPLIIMLVAAAASWVMIEAPIFGRPLYLPAWLLNIAVLAGAAYLLMRISTEGERGNQSIIIELAYFILTLLACKLAQRKLTGDVQQIIILSLLVLVAGAMFSFSGMFFFAVMVAYLAMLGYFAVLLQVYHEIDRGKVRPQLPVAAPHNGKWKFLQADLRHVAKMSVLLTIPFAFALFLLMPRTRSPSLVPSLASGPTQMGYAETVRFGEAGVLVPSETVVMNVRIFHSGGVAGSRYEEPYFRGQVLDEYHPDRKSWVKSRELESAPNDLALQTRDHPVPLWTAAEIVPAEEDLKQEYTLYLQPVRSLFTVAPAVGLSGDPAEARSYQFFQSDMVLKGRAPTLPMTYTVYSRPGLNPVEAMPAFPRRAAWQLPIGQLPIGRRERRESRLTILQVPRETTMKPGVLRRGPWSNGVREDVMVSNEIMDLAKSLAGEYLNADGRIADPNDTGNVVGIYERYLRRNYKYSLAFKQVNPRLDPTTDFLLNRKATGGHCEYFASAIVMMCRAVGLNARMVTGFRGGDYNSFSNMYIVREKHAHAWAEVWSPNMGWVTSDPTPSQSGLESTPGILQLWIRDAVQFIQSAWLALVVSFDDDSRRGFASWIVDALKTAGEGIVSFAHSIRLGVWDGIAGMESRLSLLGSLLGLAAVVLWVARRWWRGRARMLAILYRGRYRARSGPELYFMDDLMRLCERVMGKRGMHQTPLEFAGLAAGKLGEARGDASFLIETAYGVRFGGMSVDARGREKITAALGRIRKAVKGKSSR